MPKRTKEDIWFKRICHYVYDKTNLKCYISSVFEDCRGNLFIIKKKIDHNFFANATVPPYSSGKSVYTGRRDWPTYN